MREQNITLNRYDEKAYRVERDGKLIGFALALTNDNWGAFDTNDKWLTRRQFHTPNEVKKWFASNA